MKKLNAENIWRQQISDGSRNTKQMSHKKMCDYYNSDDYKKQEAIVNEEAKQIKNERNVKREWREVQYEYAFCKVDFNNNDERLSHIEKKEIYRCRSNFRILVVDDVADLREYYVEVLKNNGFINVDQADNGLTALEACKHKQYDLILCDFSMPFMNGAKFYNKLKEMNYNTNFVMVSGYCEQQLRNIKAAGILALPKCRAQELEENIRKVSLGYYVRQLNDEIKQLQKVA